jgi:nucleoside-diphosphate-sugar epimerase
MPKALITGGGGFVGKALGKRLVKEGFQVLSVARSDYPELADFGITHTRLDLSKDKEKLIQITSSCDVIFHTAAKVDMWGEFKDFYEANVVSTRHVIEACQKNKIPKLVFTSSPSVIADGKDLAGVNESYPYPAAYQAYYPQTKAEAEKEVLGANGIELKTISLRPHLIWGKGDTNLIPTVLEKAAKGKLICIGKGENLTDLTYIDDCVDAHILAYHALDKNPKAGGKAFFISQGDPVKMWEWINEILEIHKLPKVTRKLNKNLAIGLAFLLENFSKLLPGNSEPLLTRFLVCEMSTSHYFDISAAKSELGYNPKHTIKEAMKECFSV